MLFAGTWLVKCLSKIASFLRITEFATAFIVMALATSLPELFVGITSAIQKTPSLSLGNIIGANIINITLITGLIVLVGGGLKIKSKKMQADARWMSLICLLPLLLATIGGVLSQVDGIILISVFVLYSSHIIKRKEAYQKKLKDKVKPLSAFLTTVAFVALIIVLFFAARFAVKYASLLAFDLKLPELMIGLFLLSFSTTLPELIFGIRAAQLGHGEMSLGDQIGTIIVNSTAVLGVVALIQPISATIIPFFISALFLLLAAFLFVTFCQSGKKLDVREGVSLVLLYIFFVMLELYVAGKLF